MKTNSQRHSHFRLVRGLAFFLMFLACTAVAAESGMGTAAASDTGEALLITIPLGLGLAVIIIFGLVSWGKKQDSILDNTLQRKAS